MRKKSFQNIKENLIILIKSFIPAAYVAASLGIPTAILKHLLGNEKWDGGLVFMLSFYAITMTVVVAFVLPLAFLYSFRVSTDTFSKARAETRSIVLTLSLLFAQTTAFGILSINVIKATLPIAWLISLLVFVLTLGALAIVIALLTPKHGKLFTTIRRIGAEVLTLFFRLPPQDSLSRAVGIICLKIKRHEKLLKRIQLVPVFTVVLISLISYAYSGKGITDAYNPNPKEVKPRYSDKVPAEVYSYLLNLKEKLKIGERERQAGVLPIRLAETRKATVVVVDDFKPKIVLTGWHKLIPTATVTSHGEMVSKLIEHYAKKLKSLKVRIVKVDVNELNEEWKKENRYREEFLTASTAFREALLKAGVVDENLNPKHLVLLNYSMGSDSYDLPNFDVIDFRLYKELNDKGILIFTAAGNRNDHRVTGLNVTKAIGFLLPNYTVVGAPQYQPGEANYSPTAVVVSKTGTTGEVFGTSFSSPTALCDELKHLDELLGTGK